MHPSNANPRDFLVLTTQRTGSSWLMDRLDSVPGVQGHMELFYNFPRRSPGRAGRNDYPRFIETPSDRRRPWSVFDYLDGLYARAGSIGFKLMYSQLREYPEILPYVVRHRLPIIHLVRNNHLDVVLSEQLASTTGTYHSTKEEGYEQRASIELEPREVAALVQRLARKQQLVRRMLRMVPTPVHEVAYESLCHSNTPFLDMCDFIGVHGEREDREHSRLVKTQRSPHSAVIANYQEVRAALTLAGYQHLLQ